MSPSRLTRLLVLSWSLLDLMPQPATATGRLRAGQRRGEQAHHREPCPTCPPDTPGLVRDRFGRQRACPACGGSGSLWVDGITGQPTEPPGWAPSPVELPTVVRTRQARCDRCGGDGVWRHERCELCDGSGRIEVPAWADDEHAMVRDRVADPVLDAFDRRDRLGSWHQLDLALSWLRTSDRDLARRYVRRHVLDGQPASEALERAYGLLDGWMPGRLLVPRSVMHAYERRDEYALRRDLARQARMGRLGHEERDQRIRELARKGLSASEIGPLVGVSEATCRRVVNQRSRARDVASLA